MTDHPLHIEGFENVVGLRAELDDLVTELIESNDWALFHERLERWKTRGAEVVEKYMGAEEARRFKKRPIKVGLEPGSFDRMIERNRAYLDALAEEMQRDPGRVVLSQPVEERVEPVRLQRMFLSHATADRRIAALVAQRLRHALPGLEVFFTSDLGAIRSGEDWLARIKQELRAADGYLVILTPNSINRPWIWFETGAAWMSDRVLKTVSAGGLQLTDVPMPLKSFQILSLERADEAKEVFRELSADSIDAQAFAEEVVSLYQSEKDVSAGWEGVKVDERYFAWKGPELHGLSDRDSIPPPAGLLHNLDQAGIRKSFGNRKDLAKYLERGRLPVYETDQQTWRRIVEGEHPSQVLLVNPEE